MLERLKKMCQGLGGASEHADNLAAHLADLTARVEKIEAFLMPKIEVFLMPKTAAVNVTGDTPAEEGGSSAVPATENHTLTPVL